jgi:hypothetical protein
MLLLPLSIPFLPSIIEYPLQTFCHEMKSMVYEEEEKKKEIKKTTFGTNQTDRK